MRGRECLYVIKIEKFTVTNETREPSDVYS